MILGSAVQTETGAFVVSITGLPSETFAALHSLNSREPGGFRANLPKMFDEHSGEMIERILETYYVGYGHKSIGDCGSGDLYVDNCSLLAANAFEHHPMFNGQETSTRYVDVTVNGFVSTGNPDIDSWSDRWMDFYQKALAETIELVRSQHPYEGNVTDKAEQAKWKKATRTRACDICGAFLPGAARTNFSMHQELRQFADQFALTKFHPLPEVQLITAAMVEQLRRDHPNSFGFKDENVAAAYLKKRSEWTFARPSPEFVSPWYADTDIEDSDLVDYLGNLLDRPNTKAELPMESRVLGSVYIDSLIDFRSFRDLHRHRSASFEMPVLTPEFGFEEWYIEHIPVELRREADHLIQDYMKAWEAQGTTDRLTWQYATPMGFKVPCVVDMPIAASVYVAEIRSGTAVAPTARRWAINLGDKLEEWFPSLRVFICRDPDQFQIARGGHDIVKKGEEEKV